VTLSFMNKDDELEVQHRTELAMQPERERHHKRLAEIGADYTNRGLSKSTAYFGDEWEEKLNHLRQLANTNLNEIFYVLQATGSRIRKEDIVEIVGHVESAVRPALEQFSQDQARRLRECGLSSSVVIASFANRRKMDLAQLVAKVTIEVQTRAKEHDRECRKERNKAFKEWIDRVPNWWPIIVPIILVVGGWIVLRLSAK